jgi:hypothetical protein
MMKLQSMTALFVVFAISFIGAAGCAQLGKAPSPGVEKSIADVKELAGVWQGWVTTQLGSQSRVSMTIEDDGTYEGATTRGTMTLGKFYLAGGRLRYRSSRTEGTATVSEDKGKMLLTVYPEGSYSFDTGSATFERVK